MSKLKLTYFRYLHLTFINIYFNFKIKYETDLKHYHVNEKWTVNFKKGDCDDYALTKLYYLITHDKKHLFNHNNICLAECYTENEKTGKIGQGGDHLVLLIRTDKGNYVLDNRFLIIPPIQKQRYFYRRILTNTKWRYVSNIYDKPFKFRKTIIDKSLFNLIYFLRILFFGIPKSKYLIPTKIVNPPYGFIELLNRKNKSKEEEKLIEFWDFRY